MVYLMDVDSILQKKIRYRLTGFFGTSQWPCVADTSEHRKSLKELNTDSADQLPRAPFAKHME